MSEPKIEPWMKGLLDALFCELGLVPQMNDIDGRDKAISPEQGETLLKIIAQHAPSSPAAPLGIYSRTYEMLHVGLHPKIAPPGEYIGWSSSPAAPQAIDLARRFHTLYEALAPKFGYETRKESARPWSQVHEKNQNLMIAVCEEIIKEYQFGSPAAPLEAKVSIACLRPAIIKKGNRFQLEFPEWLEEDFPDVHGLTEKQAHKLADIIEKAHSHGVKFTGSPAAPTPQQSDTPDAFQSAWQKYNAKGIAGGWEKVGFTSGFGAGWKAALESRAEVTPSPCCANPNLVVKGRCDTDHVLHLEDECVPIFNWRPTHNVCLSCGKEEAL